MPTEVSETEAECASTTPHPDTLPASVPVGRRASSQLAGRGPRRAARSAAARRQTSLRIAASQAASLNASVDDVVVHTTELCQLQPIHLHQPGNPDRRHQISSSGQQLQLMGGDRAAEPLPVTSGVQDATAGAKSVAAACSSLLTGTSGNGLLEVKVQHDSNGSGTPSNWPAAGMSFAWFWYSISQVFCAHAHIKAFTVRD